MQAYLKALLFYRDKSGIYVACLSKCVRESRTSCWSPFDSQMISLTIYHITSINRQTATLYGEDSINGFKMFNCFIDHKSSIIILL